MIAKYATIIPTGHNVKAAANGSVATVEAQNRWLQPDGSVACTDTTIIRAQAIPGGRLLSLSKPSTPQT